MEYRNLGRSGLKVSELCFGTMTFHGGTGMWQAIGQLQQDEASTLVKTAFDAGINFFDTADVYSEGAAEHMLGEALRGLGLPRGEVVIATKAFGRVHPGPNGRGASRRKRSTARRKTSLQAIRATPCVPRGGRGITAG